ncbi:MAG: indole-3-glycerol phosphate synthase TrpC [Candidatus Kryptonium sp.]|nr:indole-3-glycerol phosphate synthase TrpC [Candidatus Kryptonium sp.]MDW8108719.1 indole-3-glycerol phosphate synthase TrpC [Candidatus Kryptonium sp.]
MGFLEKIVKSKLAEVERSKEILQLKDLRKLIDHPMYKHFSLSASLRKEKQLKIIAEIKNISTYSGALNSDNFSLAAIAKEYEMAGASAISVPTDFKFLGGRKQHLSQVKSSVNIPVLRKDFIIDEYQIYETKYIGADAVLLIVKIIDDVQLEDYLQLAKEIGLDVLVEVFDKHDIARVLKVSPYPKLIGINNRDPETFEANINKSIDFCKFLPDDVIKVSEGGISEREDVLKILDAGFDAILLDEVLMKAENKIAKIYELIGESSGKA